MESSESDTGEVFYIEEEGISPYASLTESDDDVQQWHQDNILLSKHLSKANNYRKEQKVDVTKLSEASNSALNDVEHFCDLVHIPSDNIEPSSSNVLKLNGFLMQSLKTFESQLLIRLEEIDEEQAYIRGKLNMLWGKKNSESHRWRRCGAPYIKSSLGEFPPPNADSVMKVQKELFLPMELNSVYVWTKTEGETLRKIVQTCIKEGKFSASKPVIDQLDWMKIAKDLNSSFSPEECKEKWRTSLDSKISRKAWKSTEFSVLCKHAEKNGYQGWDTIAKKLNSSRSGLQCCVHFQRHFRKNSPEWTSEEERKLLQLVEQFSVRWFISWPSVSYYLVTRSIRQAMGHYEVLTTTRRRGRFSITETENLRRAYKDYGGNFNEISKTVIPNRTRKQLQQRYKYWTQFSSANNRKLIRAIALNNNWSEVIKVFPKYTLYELQQRWTKILELAQNNNISIPNNMRDAAEAILNNFDIIFPSNCEEKSIPPRYDKLTKYLGQGYGYTFGPKYPLPLKCQEKKTWIDRLSIVFSSLLISKTLSQIVVAGTKRNDIIFSSLRLIENCQMTGIPPHPLIMNNWLPPNYHIVLGLFTLCNHLNALQTWIEYYETPVDSVFDENIVVEDRLLFSDAERLFHTRFFNTLYLTSILSRLSEMDMPNLQVGATSRNIKYVKKSRRNKHMKHLAEIRWEKQRAENGTASMIDLNVDTPSTEVVIKEDDKVEELDTVIHTEVCRDRKITAKKGRKRKNTCD